jgi:hypothetical protein
VVVQHLDRRHRSLLAEILGRRCPLPVKDASDEVKGQSLMGLDIGLPLEQLRHPIRACLSGDEEVVEQVLMATNRRGRIIQCRVTCTPLKGGAGAENRGVILLIDEVAGQPELPADSVMH